MEKEVRIRDKRWKDGKNRKEGALVFTRSKEREGEGEE